MNDLLVFLLMIALFRFFINGMFKGIGTVDTDNGRNSDYNNDDDCDD